MAFERLYQYCKIKGVVNYVFVQLQSAYLFLRIIIKVETISSYSV